MEPGTGYDSEEREEIDAEEDQGPEEITWGETDESAPLGVVVEAPVRKHKNSTCGLMYRATGEECFTLTEEDRLFCEEHEPAEWRTLPSHPIHKISNMGDIYSSGKGFGPVGKLLKPSKTPNGYLVVHIQGAGPKAKNEYAHRLEALAFVRNYDRERKTTVHHRNGIRTDNRAINLWFVTPLKNGRKKIIVVPGKKGKCRKVVQLTYPDRKFVRTWPSVTEAAASVQIDKSNISHACGTKGTSQSRGFYWMHLDDYEDDPATEEWRSVVYNGTQYKASTHGRLWTKTGVKTIGSPKGKYLTVANDPVHRVMAVAYLGLDPDSDDVVNHLDCKGRNNHIANLEVASVARNNQHAHDEGCHKNDAAVDQYTLKGKFVATFPSIAAAARATKTDRTTISDVCRKKCIRGTKKPLISAGGFIWRFHSETEGTDHIDVPSDDREKPVDQLDPKTGKVIATFTSAAEASRAVKSPRTKRLVNASKIAAVCNGKAKTAGTFGWRRRENRDSGSE